jgi:phosphatidylethanolamine-binding protein (PEBP) family uncharacterized protein
MRHVVGVLLRPVRAGENASRLASPEFRAAATITVTSESFADGSPIPQKHAGPGVGDNISPQLRWTGVPAESKQLVMMLDDLDVPLPKPLFHNAAVLEPSLVGLAEGDIRTGVTGLRLVATRLSRDGYTGPRPIPGHGPHRYRFHVMALDRLVPDEVISVKGLLEAISGHVIARGALTGTFER